jgi:hypothetical protein
VSNSRNWRYVACDHLRAQGVDLCRKPIAVGTETCRFGELDGIVIDVESRRVHYLVVETREGARQMLPLDVTCLGSDGTLVISAQGVDASEPFEPSAFGGYDDDSLLTLLFASHAA